MFVACPACGNPNQEGAGSCFICGVALSAVAPSGVPSAAESAQPAAAPFSTREAAEPQARGEAQAGWQPVDDGSAEAPQQAQPEAPQQAQPQGWGWGEAWPSSFAPQAYGGAPGGLAPWSPPYPSYGYQWPFMSPCPWPCWPPYFPFFYPFMPYTGAYAGYQGGQQQYAYAAAAPRKRMRPLFIALIIIGALIVIGGGVAAAVLLTGNTNATFRLGDAQVVGADVEFSDMAIKQEGATITLSGIYDNNTKSEGDIIVTVQAISGGREQLLSFTVAVTSDTGKAFTRQKPAGSIKLSGATLSSLVPKSAQDFSSGTEDKQNTFPYDQQSTQPTVPNQTSQPTFPDGALTPEQEQYLNQQLKDQLRNPTTVPQE